jgi:ribosome biogenesis GTPase
MAGPRNRRQIRRTKKALRRSGSVKRSRARQKDWTAKVDQDWDELAPESLERVMPRDELDRRKQIEQAVTASPLTGLTDPPEDSGAAVDTGNTALVTAVAGMSARIERDGVEHSATIRGLLTEIDTGYINPVAVGDRVTVSDDGSGSWAIESVLPRRTVLARPDPFLAPRQQVVATNVDQILIVSSWREPDLWPELIDRYLIAAGLSEIEPIICINKADLIEDLSAYQAEMRIYVDMGYRLILTSVIAGLGIEELRDALSHKLSVVVGLSGTGKSSLMSAVQPDLDIRIGDVSDAHGQGRHTTTQSVLYRLDAGGYVADTPGIREFGLAGLTLGELPLYYPEIDELASECRFSNCSHIEEPECAVRSAEEDGSISPSRAASYRAVFDELQV